MAGITQAKDKIVNYFIAVRSEARKVVWPDKRYIFAATVIILIVIFLVGFFILSIDIGLAKLFERLLRIRAR